MFDLDDIGGAIAAGAGAVGGAIADGAEAAVDAAGAVIETFSSAAAAFGGAAVSFGTAAVETTAQAAEQAVLDAGEIVVDAAGRVLQITQDVWGEVVTDITDTAEGIAYVAEHTVEAVVEVAEVVVEEVVTEVAEVAIDVGMWTWEASNFVQEQASQFGEDLVEFGGDLAGEVLHPVLDPILGASMTQDLIDSGVQFGTIYATGGEAALRSFVNERVAEEAGAAERVMVTEALGEDLGVPAGTVTEYGLLRAQGMDPMSAAQAVGIDPASDAADLIEEGTAPLIGEDGAAAAANFARDLITVYGQQAADNFNSGGMGEYGDGFDPYDPGVTNTPHDPGWETSRAEVDQLTDAGTEAYGELTEAIFEPVIGQDAAEQLGEYGPRIGVAVFRTIATGGLSGGEAVLAAARVGFETATGQGFEDFVGDSISTEWAETLGPEGARALGALTETGLRLGLNYAAANAGGDAPDQNPDTDDLEAFRDAFIDLGSQAVEELTGIDPAVLNRITVHIANDEWTDEDTQDLINGVRSIVPEEHRDFYDSIHAASNGDQQGALMALQNRIPPQIGQAYQAQMVQDQALMAVTGSNPMAGVPILDRLGLGTEALNAIVAADETARGVEPYTRPDNAELDLTMAAARPSPYADLPLEDVVAQEMITATAFGSIASQSGDPVLIGQAQVLMAQAVAHQQLLASGDEAAIAESLSPDAAIGAQQQVLVQALQSAAADPGGMGVAAQVQGLLAQTQAATQDLVEENGPPGPPSHYADLPLEAVIAQELSTANALSGIAAQTGNVGIGQQAQVLMAQALAHQQILASGDEDAIADLVPDMAIGAQNMALSQALGQAAAQGPGGTAAALQVQSLLGQTQAQTDALYNQYGPPPPAVNETLAAATAIAQEQDLARTLNTMAAQAGPNAPLIAQQAQFLQAQARAHMQALATGQDANGNPVTAESVIASQQQALATSLQAAMVPTPGPGGIPTVTPGAQAVAGQLQGLLGQAQVHRDTLADQRADYDLYQRTHPAEVDPGIPGGDGRDEQFPPGHPNYQGPNRDPYDPGGDGRDEGYPPGHPNYEGPNRDPYDPGGDGRDERTGDNDRYRPDGSAADADDFEDNIMAPHLEAAPGTVRAQLDTDGDGQLSAEEISVRGIAGQAGVDDGGLEWEASSGDALTGQPATLDGGTAPTATAATEPAEAPIEAAAPPPPPEPAAPPVEAPAPEAEAEPMPPPAPEESYEEPPAPADPEPEVPEDDDGMV